MDWLTERVLAAVFEVTNTLGGTAKWIESEFKNYSPRLEVSLQPFSVPKTQRTPRDLDLVNIVAVLPGTIDKDRYVIISGHYDSIALRRPQNGAVRTPMTPDPRRPPMPIRWRREWPMTAAGPAATMELARVMSQYTFDKSIVFVTFAAEEIGLNGSKAYAAKAREEKAC